jgi:hypothetical protein
MATLIWTVVVGAVCFALGKLHEYEYMTIEKKWKKKPSKRRKAEAR